MARLPPVRGLALAAILGLGLYCGFEIFYLDLKAPTKTLLSMDGYQIVVCVGVVSWEPSIPPSC